MSPPLPPALPIPRRRLAVYVLFGLILPVVCVLADPMVFVGMGPMDGRPMLWRFRAFGYLQIAVGLVALGYFVVRQRPSALLAGMLSECAFFSYALGVVLAPMSFLGMFALIGLLGFTPFVSAWVCRDASRRAMSGVQEAIGKRAATRRWVAGAVLALGIPFGSQVFLRSYTDHLVRQVILARASSSEVGRLAHLRTIADLDPLLEAYAASPLELWPHYAMAYWHVTGHSADTDLLFLHGFD